MSKRQRGEDSSELAAGSADPGSKVSNNEDPKSDAALRKRFARFKGMGTWVEGDQRSKAKFTRNFLPPRQVPASSSSKRTRDHTIDRSNSTTTTKRKRGKTSGSASRIKESKASSSTANEKTDKSDASITPRPVRRTRAKVPGSASRVTLPKVSSLAKKPRGKTTGSSSKNNILVAGSSGSTTRKRARQHTGPTNNVERGDRDPGDTTGNSSQSSRNDNKVRSRKRRKLEGDTCSKNGEKMTDASVDDLSEPDDLADVEMETKQLSKELRQKRPAKPKDVAIDGTLPPLHDIQDIFAHMASQALGLGNGTLKSFDGEVLRLGTMCSGTEAPVLFLEAICKREFETYDIT